MKRLLLLVALALPILVAGCYDFNNPVDPEAADYQGYPSYPPDLWPYYREIEITSGGGPLTDYQVAIRLDTPLMGSPYSHIKSDGSDLRFRDSTGNELSYWIESWDPAGSSLVWVKMSTIPSGSSSIYLYYGNTQATPASNGADTYIVFDDFEDHVDGDWADLWYPTNSYRIVDDGGRMVFDDGVATGRGVYLPHANIADVAVRQMFRSVSGEALSAGVLARYLDDANLVCGGPVAKDSVSITEEVTGSGVATVGGPWLIADIGTSWHIQELRVVGTTATLLFDDAVMGSAAISGGLPTGKTGFWTNDSGIRCYRDWHAVRKYASPDPTLSIGSEQTS